MREGLLDVFVEAGAMVSTPTCGACFGGGKGVLGPGERAVTTTNRNFKGRMGSPEAEVYLANAYVAAAAAVAGELVDPAGGAGVIIEGRAVVIPGADVDTDVMYPGQFLNIDDPEQMKPYLFEGFDPTLRDQLGDDAILVTGPNFGIGSSREHVPQAMKAWGVQAVVGPSFARIFRRNCVNLGLPGRRGAGGGGRGQAGLVASGSTPTRARSRSTAGRFAAAPVAPLVEELQSAGGLVAARAE